MSTTRSSPAPLQPAELQPTDASPSEASRVQGERLLTVKEAALSLGLCVDSVRRHLRSGKLQGVRVGGGWRVPESRLALQLGLLTIAALPALDVIEEEHKRSEPKLSMVRTQHNGAGNELLDTIFETRPVRARVLQMVEAAAVAAAIPPQARKQLARELETSFQAQDEDKEG